MITRLYTIGNVSKTVETFFDILKNASVARLLVVRQFNSSQLSATRLELVTFGFGG
jgi:uncharacterized protein (DUF488 family)